MLWYTKLQRKQRTDKCTLSKYSGINVKLKENKEIMLKMFML